MNMINSSENVLENITSESKNNEEQNGGELEDKKSHLQRAGTMDVTALEGISILHREGVSVESTVDHLRSGGKYKSPAKVEPDSTNQEVHENEEVSHYKDKVDGETGDNNDPIKDIDDKEEVTSELVSSSLEEKEEDEKEEKSLNEDKKAGTTEESKEILHDEELGKTRSQDAAPDSTNNEIASPIRRTLTMMATIEEGKSVLGRQQLGKTRSQDRKRSTPYRRATDGKSPAKRKRN